MKLTILNYDTTPEINPHPLPPTPVVPVLWEQLVNFWWLSV